MNDQVYLSQCAEQVRAAQLRLEGVDWYLTHGNPPAAIIQLAEAIHFLAHAENWWGLFEKYEKKHKPS